MSKVIVTILGSLGIVFVYWFFLMKKGREIIASDSIDIIVSGGFSPEIISIAVGKKTRLNFIRKDPSSCLEEIVMGDFGIRRYLPLNKITSVEIIPRQTGEFKYSCAMNMFHGIIKVK